MASSRCKCFHKKKSRLDLLVSSLRKENVSLKKAIVELSYQQSEHFKIVETLISLYGGRVENPQQQVDEDSETVLPSASSRNGQTRRDAVNMQRISFYVTEMEDIKNKLLRITARCQNLDNKAKGKKDITSDEQTSGSNFAELEAVLKDALEKNKQWLKYDQEREACVRAIMARMIWLEKELHGAKESDSRQHNDNYSHEKKEILQMQEYYEGLLEKAKHEVNVLREQVTMTQQKLTTTQKLCLKMETEAEELKQMLRTEEMKNRPSPWKDHQGSEEEAKRLKEKTKDLEFKLQGEKRRSATFELQVNLLQKYMINCHNEHQEKIEDLEQQLCSINTCSSSRSSLNESFLKCPGCCLEYPATDYQELMQHLEICLD